ncbi:MAG: CRISPR-associated protein Cas4 [Candidatus Aenigmarchaeota archaeon]|nr:CRISPR-associated protein Cas4 [Candidatus Aenigmarchaeota archaeon]
MGFQKRPQNSSFQKSEELEFDPEMLIGGTKVNYFIHCKTQLWLFSQFILQEKESELVLIGKILESLFFKEMKMKNILIDSKISIDLIRRGEKIIIQDIKKSSKFEKAHYYQVLYYMWYLKNVKGITNLEGIISYPNERKTIKVELTEEKEREIEKILKEINEIISRPKPPLPVYKKYCRKCAYFEFCFGDT